MGRSGYRPFYQRNLPHIQPVDATLFVTFRLAGSVPRCAVDAWRAERQQLLAEARRITDPAEHAKRLRAARHRWFRTLERILHEGSIGPTWLGDDRVAAMLADCLRDRDGSTYRLDAFSIMRNHGHVVFAPLPSEHAGADPGGIATGLAVDADLDGHVPHALAAIMQSLKGYSAWRTNRLLGRRGAFWEHESYDHVVRDEREWGRVIRYVLNNPVKAGLVTHWRDWPWNYYAYDTGADD